MFMKNFHSTHFEIRVRKVPQINTQTDYRFEWIWVTTSQLNPQFINLKHVLPIFVQMYSLSFLLQFFERKFVSSVQIKRLYI